MYVDTPEALRALVDRFRQAPLVGIDTEFMRERTYFAKLCLVQVSTAEESAIIDPIAVTDLSPLCELLTDRKVLKVLHAGTQDLEIFYRICGESTAPVFDTQVAATLAGFPQQVGYGALVHELLGVKLDKGDTYTDWGKRPLSTTQIEYALNDVRYLPEVHKLLTERLADGNRLAWLADDFSDLEAEETYQLDETALWRRVKRVSSLNRRQLAIAREVTAWREREAMRRDVPRRWVLGDESIVEVARRAPATVDDAYAIRGVGDKVGRGAMSGLLAAVQAGVSCAEDDLPSLPKRKRPTGDVDGPVDLMVALVRLRARQNGVAMPLLASRDDLERLAAGERDSSPLLEGWRRTMVGNELVELIDGEISLSVSDGELVVQRD